MPSAPLRVLASPEAIGDLVAGRLLARIEEARISGARFLLGCPTGRTPRPLYEAMARRLGERPQDIGHLVLVMMDEYLVPGADGLVAAPADAPWSCRRFARVEIAGRLDEALPPPHRLPDESVWLPDPRDPASYDRRIADAGGVDCFVLASGASDGHVAFNPPGTPRASRTRLVELSEETRRDNLLTFPSFGSLAAVPHHGVSVGIATIASAREAVMMVWGEGKRLTLARMLAADRYEPDWPATVIHACARGEILSDVAAAGRLAAAADRPHPRVTTTVSSSPTSSAEGPVLGLTSTAFTAGGGIPARHTCEGADVSPPLAWSGAPDGTRSFALIVDDPDAPDPAAPKRVWVHWVLYNVPASTDRLAEGASPSRLPAGAREGRHDGGGTGYSGPCPPIGRHRYFHKLFALDTLLPDLGADAGKAELERAMQGHVLASAELIGTYESGGRRGGGP